MRKPVLILPLDGDKAVTPTVDRENLFRRWVAACPDGVVSEFSGFIPGAGPMPGAEHQVWNEEAGEWLVDRVVRFCGRWSEVVRD